jgi:hypothetical protein
MQSSASAEFCGRRTGVADAEDARLEMSPFERWRIWVAAVMAEPKESNAASRLERYRYLGRIAGIKVVDRTRLSCSAKVPQFHSVIRCVIARFRVLQRCELCVKEITAKGGTSTRVAAVRAPMGARVFKEEYVDAGGVCGARHVVAGGRLVGIGARGLVSELEVFAEMAAGGDDTTSADNDSIIVPAAEGCVGEEGEQQTGEDAGGGHAGGRAIDAGEVAACSPEGQWRDGGKYGGI